MAGVTAAEVTGAAGDTADMAVMVTTAAGMEATASGTACQVTDMAMHPMRIATLHTLMIIPSMVTLIRLMPMLILHTSTGIRPTAILAMALRRMAMITTVAIRRLAQPLVASPARR